MLAELIASLRALVDAARESAGAIRAARDQVEGSLEQVRAATVGSDSPLVAEGDGQLQAALGKIDEAAALLEAGNQSWERYIAGPLLGGGSSGGGVGRKPPGATPPSTPEPEPLQPFGPPIDGFSPQRLHREPVDQLRREGWPTNAEGKTSARGHLYDQQGRRVRETPYRAYKRGEAPVRSDLRAPWASDPELTSTWHAESDAAADIRSMGGGEHALYINIPPCGRSNRDPKRCDANLEKILPTNTTLYVWEISENGSRTRYIYRGNGEAIK
nr:DddA-like double-stranded DNA deaminase toxin [Glycomyces amatae]